MSRRLYGALMHQVAKRGRLHVLRVFRRELGPPARCEPPSGLELRALSQAELVARCGDPELDLREAMIRDAFRRGDLCLGALDGGSLVGYVWFAYGTAPHVHGVWVQNLASVAATLKSGSRPLGMLAYWQASRWFVAFHSRTVRRLGLRFYLA